VLGRLVGTGHERSPVNSAITHFTAAQREADLVREARRNPFPTSPPAEPAAARGRFAELARRLVRPVALRTVSHRRL
jgi:hypothetical protein